MKEFKDYTTEKLADPTTQLNAEPADSAIDDMLRMFDNFKLKAQAIEKLTTAPPQP